MNTNRIFIGNVMCDKELAATNVVLVKCKNNLYVALDNIETFVDIYKINHNKSNLLTFPATENEYYYVDNNSLTPYYEKHKQKTLGRIKMDVLVDSRNPRGIDH